MFAKRSARAMALLLALPSAAFALGLGDIHLHSPLNAPLDADIELVDVAAGRGQYRAGPAGLARYLRALRPGLAGVPELDQAHHRARQRRPADHPAALHRSDHRALRHPAGGRQLVARPPGARIHHAARPAGVRTGRIGRGECPGRSPRHRHRRARRFDCARGGDPGRTGPRGRTAPAEAATAAAAPEGSSAAPAPPPPRSRSGAPRAMRATAAATAQPASCRGRQLAPGAARRDAVGDRQRRCRRGREHAQGPQLDARDLPGEPPGVPSEHERAALGRGAAHPRGLRGGGRLPGRGDRGDPSSVRRLARRGAGRRCRHGSAPRSPAA